ncbi:MAG TPA: CBS domain-containing protein [Herpetosiphonaceae bacterium]|nr:CBS domain-containing protein [Herpetosiphonaceae bacterium]
MKIRTVLATKGMNMISISPEQTLKEAIGVLAQHNIGALLVLDADKSMVGILSERDIIRHIARDEQALGQPIASIMTSNVITGRPQDDVQSVMATMTERRFRHLPIMDGDALIGIISIGDVVKAQMDDFQGKIDTLQTQIIEGEATE